jgi:hypothetical protein
MGNGVEAIARAWAPKPSAWMGGEGGSGVFRSGSLAEFAGGRAAGCDDYDLALMLWQAGVDDPATRAKCKAALLVAGSHAAQSPGRWPQGRLEALVDLALVELMHPAERWTDEVRRTWVGVGVTQPAWSQTWRPRYQYLLSAAWKGAGRARWRIGLGRGE